MEKIYDEEQTAAINAHSGYYLVLAPPGCGKTDILSERVVQARKQGVNYADMLCLTFTNRASRGMKNRIMQKVGGDASQVFVGNVHRFCSNFLFANGILPQSTCIIDDDDLQDILLSFSPQYFLTWNQAQVDRRKIQFTSELAAYLLQRKLNQPEAAWFEQPNCAQYYPLAEKCHFDPANLQPGNDALRYALLYIIYKRERNYIDFNDILILSYQALLNDKEGIYKRYPWVQVDEVQDLNALQTAIIDELTCTTDSYTVMYLGDEQQAIFSFMGAKLSQLEFLKTRCKDHVLTLGRNYRSPKYLLDVFNTYARDELHVNENLLPQPTHEATHDRWDLILAESATAEDENQRISRMVSFYLSHPDERLAILVPTNAAADRISQQLTREGITNFKISGADMFKSRSYKTLSAFFNVVVNEFNVMGWVRLLYGIGAFKFQSEARLFLKRLKELMMTPFDLLSTKSYIAQFNEVYLNHEMVFFDTETTGLDVENDDIVQIAAFKVNHGTKVPGSDFIIFLHTDRPIPLKLGIIDNPLIKAYAENKHYARQEGLQLFLDYIGTDAVLGHNVNYDYHILQHNVRRTLHKEVELTVYDSLHLAKCVEPDLPQYKLDYLIHRLKLEGKNSHLANEDVEATLRLVEYCVDKSKGVALPQQEFMEQTKVKNIIRKLAALEPIFESTRQNIAHKPSELYSLSFEFASVYDKLRKMKLIDDLGPKFPVFLRYIQSEWSSSNDVIADQLYQHVNEMTVSVSEGDLVNSTDARQCRVYIMTVYKGKGLEFENVIILGANDGTYPYYTVYKKMNSSYASDDDIRAAHQEMMEDARKFYVGLTRARKRICVSYSLRNSYGIATHLTPFMECIRPYFFTGKRE